MLRIIFCSRIVMAIFMLLFSCNLPPTPPDKQNFYRDVFERLIMAHHYDHCIIATEELDRRYYQFLKQDDPRKELEAFIDSLKEERKKIATKCEIRYTSENNIPAMISDYGDSVIADAFTAEYFREISPKTIIDTISRSMTLPVEEWSMQYLTIVPHNGSIAVARSLVFRMHISTAMAQSHSVLRLYLWLEMRLRQHPLPGMDLARLADREDQRALGFLTSESLVLNTSRGLTRSRATVCEANATTSRDVTVSKLMPSA